jgi:hypothetical protein
MHSPNGLLFDVNTTNAQTNPTIAYFAGLPHNLLHTPVHAPPPAGTPSNLQTISNFFKPRLIFRQTLAPTKSNDIFGDAMATPITPNRTRLYFINLNGINLTKGAVKFPDLCSKIQQADINILAASEHNLDTNKFIV